MPSLEVTIEQVIALIKQLPTQEQLAVFSVLSAELEHKAIELDAETQEWIEADLVNDLPPYDWGTAEIPTGKSIRYVPGQGLVIEGGKSGV
jgi:hypothetical protein